MLILSKQDAEYVGQIFIDYYSNFDRIDDYLRKVKLEKMAERPASLFGMGPEDDMFQDFTMHPNDMEFVCREMPIYDDYIDIVASQMIQKSIPGKTLKWVVYEKNTNKIVGFIRFGSPTINSKPRNEFLGKPLNTTDKDTMKRFNDSTIMGFNIIPTQPFGFNYLGGKLLAAICTSHYARRALNKKYNTKYCMFETTSLYGSSKSSSMYDGMKPYLRFIGLTDSDFVPSINDEKYHHLKEWFENKNNGVPLVDAEASSRKLKTQGKMISIIRNSLEKNDSEMLRPFKQCFVDAKNLTERKRQYLGTYGYKNVKEYMNSETDTLEKNVNFDRFELENVITWWKKMATKRYENLQRDGRLRTELEVWSKNQNIDIIR
tara:strand:- start:1731 stop:2855 length:1125 start_codon:yes stop_codon:yes gene_type:complete